MQPDTGGHRITVGGNVTGLIAQGDNNTQTNIQWPAAAPPPDAGPAELRGFVDTLVEELRAHVAAESPEDQRAAALERVDELRDAVVAEEPDLTTMAYVRRWFARNLPKLAGAVTGLILNPVVGKVVEAAGELAAGEFRRLFGAEKAE
jgi:hypothetical protein